MLHRSVALGVALSLSACSFAFVTGPPSADEAEAQVRATGEIECTRSPVMYLLDTAFVVIAGLAIYQLARFPDEDGDVDVPWVVASAAVGGAALGSAIYGRIETSACRRLYRSLAAERRDWKLGR